MDHSVIDDLARGLHRGRRSRRHALQIAGAIALAALTPSAPTTAATRSRKARRRCRAQQGVPLAGGTCPCGWQCGPDPATFACNDNPACTCYQDSRGRGFCGTGSANARCTTNAECAPDRKCAVNTCARGLCIAPCP